MISSEGKIEIAKINMEVSSIDGFSGHSDRRQILSYLRRVTPKPERIVVCHGERGKCLSVAKTLQRKYRVKTRAPEVLETLRLR